MVMGRRFFPNQTAKNMANWFATNLFVAHAPAWVAGSAMLDFRRLKTDHVRWLVGGSGRPTDVIRRLQRQLYSISTPYHHRPRIIGTLAITASYQTARLPHMSNRPSVVCANQQLL